MRMLRLALLLAGAGVVSLACPLPEGPCGAPADCPPDQECRDGQCHNRLGFSIPALGPRDSASSSSSSSSSGGSSSSSSSSSGGLCTTLLSCAPAAAGVCAHLPSSGGPPLCLGSITNDLAATDVVHAGDVVQVAVLLRYTGDAGTVTVQGATVEVKDVTFTSQAVTVLCPQVLVPFALSNAAPERCVQMQATVQPGVDSGDWLFGAVGVGTDSGNVIFGDTSSPVFRWTVQ
ncbi:MAG: hypothetical protein HY904_14325 [Deltaproteobacteria bacterium]|nr:hypothetical protein [Deltaproteobacteria bacterium]